MSPGYLKLKDQNAQLFTADGFLKSQDIGFYDENHFFYICGRKKDIIKVDGVSVALKELEQILMANKDVSEAAVIGVKDTERGESPMAFVTLVDGSDVTEEQLVAYVNDRVNDHKKLTDNALRVLDTMPKTHTGKVRKGELYSLATNLIWARHFGIVKLFD